MTLGLATIFFAIILNNRATGDFMRIELQQKTTSSMKSPTIIVGFPGVGLVGPIVTEFLIEHMKTEPIGEFIYDELPAMVAIHKGVLVHPMSLHYSALHNTIIVYTILNLKNNEWHIARAIQDFASRVKAKEILCIDGANAIGDEKEVLYSFGNPRLAELGAKPMEESVIVGVTGALLLASPATVSCLFASTHVEMQDSKAAAEAVKFLDKYLGLDVDYNPLLAQAEKFEEKLKSVMAQGQKLMGEKERKSMEYLG